MCVPRTVNGTGQLLARPVLALLGNDPLAVLRAGRGDAEPLAVLDRDLLAPELARPITIAELGRRAASALTRLDAWRTGVRCTAVAARTPMTNDAIAETATTRLMPALFGF